MNCRRERSSLPRSSGCGPWSTRSSSISIDPNRETRQVLGPSGTLFNLEVEAFFDVGGKTGNIRVMVSIDDGRGLRAFVPLTADFIMAPDGTFVGE